jgi:DNA-binding response OmpR family regulator
MNRDNLRRLLLLTDDDLLAKVLATYLSRDGIEVGRVPTVAAMRRSIAEGADGIVVDLAKRDATGSAITELMAMANRWEIAAIILSAQPRRDVLDFGEVVRATDVVSKTESVPAIAARLRVSIQTPRRRQQSGNVNQLSWALA